MNTRDTTKDLDYAIEWNRRVFTPLGVWPLKRNASASERTTKRIRMVISCCILFVHVIPQYLSMLLADRSMEEYLSLVASEVFQSLGAMKFFILIINSEKIAYCVHCIEDDWLKVKLEEDRQTMYINAKVGRYLTIYCLGFMYGGSILYIAVWPFLNEGSETKQGNISVVSRPLPHPASYVYFDERSTPIYEITWIIQLVGSAYACALNCGVYTITGVLIAHASGQLQVIGSRLEDLIDGNRKEFPGVNQRMAGIVGHHASVIRYTKCVNNAFQMTFLTDVIGALAVICFVGYMVITAISLIIQTWNDNHFTPGTLIWTMLMVATTFNIFVISYVGQQLQDKSQQVGIASGRVPWYRLQPTYARPLILCMARSAIPLKLSAFDMFDLSLANFGDVLRTSLVFLNMVRQVTNLE